MGIAMAFLGTGTCHATPRNPSSFAISDGTQVALIDCGGGCYHQLPRIRDPRFRFDAVESVLLTHFHADHTAGLIDLLWGEMWASEGPRRKPLTIAGPVGVRGFVENRLLPFLGNYRPPFPISIVEMSNDEKHDFGFFIARAVKLAHANPSCGYRIEAGGVRLAVTGDTGYCDSLVALLADCDVAVMEWAMPGPSDTTEHITPEAVHRLIESGHLPPVVYAVHLYCAPGLSFEEQVEAHRNFLGVHASRFRFPRDGEVFDLA